MGHFRDPYFQRERTFLVKTSFIWMRIKKKTHVNGFALSLALKQRLRATSARRTSNAVVIRSWEVQYDRPREYEKQPEQLVCVLHTSELFNSYMRILRAYTRTHLVTRTNTKNTVGKIIRYKEQVLSGLLRELIQQTQFTRNEDCQRNSLRGFMFNDWRE